MNKKIFLILALTLANLMAQALPAKSERVTLTQPDGTTIEAIFSGDFFMHGYYTLDGRLLRQQEDGFYVVVSKEEQAAISASANERRQQHNRSKAERTDRMYKHLLKQRVATRSTETPTCGGTTQMAPQPENKQALTKANLYSGNKKALIILAEFSNLSFRSTNTRESYVSQFNKTGYNLNNHIGSLKDYFYDNSYGKLNIDFDVVGPIRATNKNNYYGKDSGNNIDINIGELIVEACKGADSQVNYEDYDWDGDGYVDLVYVLYAGFGQHYSGNPSDLIWPHEWTLTSACGKTLTLDGVKIDTYAVSSELAGKATSSGQRDGIGTVAHESSHILGLVDSYSTGDKEKESPAMNFWSLQCKGNYLGPDFIGEVPVGLSAYERWCLGWITPKVLNKPTTVTEMRNIDEYPDAYVIYNPNYKNELYLLENRQNVRWMTYPEDAHGMLVTHITYDKKAWEENTVNSDPNFQRYTYIPANNDYGHFSNAYIVDIKEHQAALYPGLNGITELSDDTAPAFNPFYGDSQGRHLMLTPITNIQESADGIISFDFMGGDPNDIELTETDTTTDADCEFITLSGIRLASRPSSGTYIEKSSTTRIVKSHKGN